MNLIPGRRIGVYEVLEPLGAGGMGEVYRARDTRLGRDVAIKVLPREVAADPDRRARLEREARLLASLNHPNIATLHGIEDSPDGCALVMELVDGETLADRLALREAGQAGLQLNEALTIARQIADALESAHERGIVHRDLKPANIKVRQDGTVKVLDFGLATALTLTSTGSLAATAIATEQPGIVSGTAPYMSPEQARGETASPRTDIWSFGVVLYELLTGVSPFARPTTAATLASVLAEEPDFARLPSETPAAVGRLIRRCLKKDQRERLRHIGDAGIELTDGASTAGPDSDSAVSRPPRATRARIQWVAIGIGICVLAALMGWSWRSPVVAEQPAVVRYWIPVPEPGYPVPVGARHLAISPDGTRMAYAGRSGLWLRHIAQPSFPTLVPMTAASSPFFSPDGQWVGFFGQTGGEALLLKVPAQGGHAVTVVSAPDRSGGGTWRADGTIVFAAIGGLYQVPAAGGERQLLARPDAGRKERGYLWPEFLPDGRSVLFTIVRDGSIDSATTALLDLSTLQISTLLAGSDAHYVPTGQLIYASGQTLKAVAFDAGLRRTHGEPVALPELAVSAAINSGAAEFAVSPTGTLLFLPAATSESFLRTMSWMSRSGKEEPLGLAPDRYGYPRISPDETRIAVDIAGTRRNISIWDLRRSWLTRLTDGPIEDLLPVWSSDSSRLFFASRLVDGDFDVYSQAADGATPARREFAAPGSQGAHSFTPDGRLLIALDYKDIGLFTLGSSAVEPLLHSSASEWTGAVSPDGNWIAYESNESGDRMEIFVRPFPAVAGRREQVSIEGGRWPVWGPKGSRELYYVDPNGQMMAAAIELSPRLRVGRVTKLFDWRAPPAGISGIPYDVSRRDGRFLVTEFVTAADERPALISVVVNWFEELTRAVPGS